MIARELLDELRTICINFAWEYCGPSRKIRGKLKSRFDDVLFDPIGAVCLSKTGLVFGENQWLGAARKIELSSIDAGDLIAAANNVRTRSDYSYIHSLRRQIVMGVLLRPEPELPTGVIGEVLSMSFLFSLFKKTGWSAKISSSGMDALK